MVTKSEQKTFGCIIPFYNEGSRILGVLNAVLQIKNISTVMCVDDGSIDNSYSLIEKKFPYVKIIRSEKNHGKSSAVLLGIQEIQEEFVVLLDADLYNINPEEIENAMNVIRNDAEVDMIVFRRSNDPWYSKILRGDITVPGERIIRTEDLRKLLINKPPHGNQLEFAINIYMQEKKKCIYWMPFAGTNVKKINKFGFWKGLQKEIEMHIDMMEYAGIFKTLKCIITFCHKKYPIN